MKKQIDLVIIGAGPAGMSAAIAAYDAGVRDLLVLERDSHAGGILRQCIHNGFGLHRFGEELTGPEYAWKYEKLLLEKEIPVFYSTTVLSLGTDKRIVASNDTDGVFEIEARAVILAMGCRERPRGALSIPGSRPSGIFTAGAAQKYVNLKGYLPGHDVVILGSGDIGLIMARRMTLEGARVHAVCELMPYSGGLARNIEQCLHDFDIPLLLSHTVVEIHGRERLCGVTIAQVDENRRPIDGTQRYIPCDTLLLSVGLIPENELTVGAGIALDAITNGAYVDQNRETEIFGVFSAGNVLHVHDLVDYVSEEAEIAGRSAAAYLNGALVRTVEIPIKTGLGIRYTVPGHITQKKDVTIYFRVSACYRNAYVTLKDGERVLYHRKKARLSPGEMEHVTLSSDALNNARALTVSLEVQ